MLLLGEPHLSVSTKICMEPQDFCPVGILLCFYHSENRISTKLFKKPSLLLMSKGCKWVFSSSAPPSMKKLLPPPPTVCNWTLKCRHASQLLIHLKLTGRPDYGGTFLLQTPYRHHLYRNTCRNMKELPGSISQSIVCQLCQQTEGKLFHKHLNPGV